MDIKLSISVAVIAAILAAEILSLFWYSDSVPWGRSVHQRYWVAALAADVGLAFLVQWIIGNHWSVRKWEDAAMLAVGIGLLYACLEAPHSVWDHRSFCRFFFHTAHKVAIVFVMAMALHYFKNY